jgi:hypothetical protein
MLRTLKPLHDSTSNEGQPVFADCAYGTEKNGAVNNGKTADPDDTVRFKSGRFKISIVLANSHIEIFQSLRQLGRDHADEPIIEAAGKSSKNERGAEFA